MKKYLILMALILLQANQARSQYFRHLEQWDRPALEWLDAQELSLNEEQSAQIDPATGFFLQLGGADGLRFGLDQDLLRSADGGEGALGYVWGAIGLRGSFLFPQNDPKSLLKPDVRQYNGSVDLVFFPYQKYDFVFRPYLFYGLGTPSPVKGVFPDDF